MAEQYDGGSQTETNEDLDVEGYVDTGINSAKVLVESSSTLMSSAASAFATLEKLFTSMVTMLDEELLNEHLHVHQFHKHRSCQGHKNTSPLELEMVLGNGLFVSSGGKFFANGHQHTAVNMLLNEMIHNKDLDDNGKIFFHDFIFDWEDPQLPPGIKTLKNNPFMPGNTLYPYKEESYVLAFNEYLIDYLDNNVIKDGYRKPKILKRSTPCIVMSWNEYYSQINDCFKEYLVI